MFEYVFPQQCLLLIGKEGKHMLKRYMSDVWETFGCVVSQNSRCGNAMLSTTVDSSI